MSKFLAKYITYMPGNNDKLWDTYENKGAVKAIY
jgi:hypothetical protein